MEKALVKSFFDACHYARHITHYASDMMNTLPDGIQSHHIFTIDALHSITVRQGATASVRGATVPDVASFLGVSQSTAGDYVRDLAHKGLVQGTGVKDSRRRVRVELTDKGKEYHAQYVEKYYDRMMGIFASINNNDMHTTIRTIKQAFYLLSREVHKDN